MTLVYVPNQSQFSKGDRFWWSMLYDPYLCNTSSGWFFTWNVGGNTNLLFRNNFVEHIQHSVLLLLAVIIQHCLLFFILLSKEYKNIPNGDYRSYEICCAPFDRSTSYDKPQSELKKKSQLLMAPYANGMWEAVRIRDPWLAEIIHIHELECGWEWHGFC